MTMKTFITFTMLIVTCSQTTARASEDAAAREAVVTSTAANMYSEPDETKGVVSQAIFGLTVKVLREQDGYSWIETPEPYRGWVRSKELRPYETTDQKRYADDDRAVEVTSLMCYAYRRPDVKSAQPIARCPLGARLERSSETATSDSWIPVVLPGGENGYVQRGDVRSVQSTHKDKIDPQNLIATARRMLGVPYLWGGMTPLGLDCSGYVGLVYRVHGVRLRRDSREQFADPEMKEVERSDLQPGDLLYFGGQRISHVGMYIGGGRFIHSTTYGTPAVQESRLDEPHWSKLYRGARRPQ